MKRGLTAWREVVEHAVGHRLVERAFVAVRPDVELEALQLDTSSVGDVIEVSVAKSG